MAELYRSDIVDVDISKSLLRTYAGIVLATGDKNANRFGANIFRAGEPVDLTGCTVLAYFIRPNTDTLPIDGKVEGNTAYVDLPAACYTSDGAFSLAIKISSTDITQTVRVVDGCIRLTQTDNLVDPGEVVPSLDELFATIAAMETATNAARETADDAAATAAEAKQIMKDAATPIVEDVNGGIIAVTDGAARPVVGLVSTITATQAGTGDPGADNVRPITGLDAVNVKRTGKNLLNTSQWTNKTTSGITFTNNGDGSVSVAGTNATSSPVNHQVAISLPLKAGTYMVSGCGTTATGCYSVITHRSNGAVAFAYGDKQLVIDTDQTVVCYIQVAAGATVDVTLWPMIEVGSVATAFEAYQGVTLNAALPETVYGGYLDWTTGLLTVTHGVVVLDGTEAWGGGDGSPYYLIQGIPRAGISAVPPVCSHYLGADVYHTSQEGVQATPTKIWLRDRRFVADAAGLQAWFAAQAAAGTPVQIVYQLAEPYTVQIDPQVLETLRGSNVIWSDCGNTAVAYIADTKTYVDAHTVGGSGSSVASVNGKTGAVVLNAADVGAMPADAQIVDADAREQIAELSEELEKLKDDGPEMSPNLCNPDTMSAGCVQEDGYHNGSTTYIVTDYIAVTPGETLHFSTSKTSYKSGVRFICAYNASFGVMEDAGVNQGGGSNVVTSYVVPEGVAYVRLSFWADVMAIMVNTGDAPLPYVPYGPIGGEDNGSHDDNVLWGKKWAVCGDSFTDGDFTNALDTDYTIMDGLYEGKNATYGYLIGNRNNMTIQHLAAGGMTMATPADGSFTNALTYNNKYQEIAEDVDYITLYYGINDSHHASGESGTDGEDVTGAIAIGTIDDTGTDTFAGAYQTVLEWLIVNRPFAHIGILVSNGCDSDEYRTMTIEIAKKWGVPYIDLNGDERTPMMLRSTNPAHATAVKNARRESQAVNPASNLHPNAKAHAYESIFIEAFLRSI